MAVDLTIGAQPVFDLFDNYPDGVLSTVAGWRYPTADNWNVAGGVIQNGFTGATKHYAGVSGPTWSDCAVFYTLRTSPTPSGVLFSVFARASGVTDTAITTGYEFQVLGIGASCQLRVNRYAGGVATLISGVNNVALSQSDRIMIRCVGTTISTYYFHSGSWTLYESDSDGRYSSGIFGFAGYANTLPNNFLDTLCAGSLNDPSTVVGPIGGRGATW